MLLKKRSYCFPLFLALFAHQAAWAGLPPSREAYVMISGYGLYPPLDNPADPATKAMGEALSTIGQHHVAGIVYGTLGVPPQIKTKARIPETFDPNVYNAQLFDLARKRGATIWLQLRYYDNFLPGPHGEVSLTAPEIMQDPAGQAAFLSGAMTTIATYQKAFPEHCTIILGEEETPYHSKQGGGLFWAGSAAWNDPQNAKRGKDEFLKETPALDQQFIINFSAINHLLISTIRKQYPACRVGIHIGHEPLYGRLNNVPLYQLILQQLPPLDFTFYDLYEKISKTDEDFYQKLSQRIQLLKQLGQRVYYLAQLHTTNSFGAGGGRTPGASEIDATFSLAQQLGVDGFGYYTKNAVPTACTATTMATQAGQCNLQEDNNPLDPNTEGQEMVYQNALQRWSAGLAKLDAFLDAH